MLRSRKTLATCALLLTASFSGIVQADDYKLTLKDHQFSPAKLTVPAGETIKLVVKNEQTTPAEFESSELGREKVVAAGSSIIVKLGPLDAGDYHYVDDFHRDTTGVITAK